MIKKKQQAEVVFGNEFVEEEKTVRTEREELEEMLRINNVNLNKAYVKREKLADQIKTLEMSAKMFEEKIIDALSREV